VDVGGLARVHCGAASGESPFAGSVHGRNGEPLACQNNTVQGQTMVSRHADVTQAGVLLQFLGKGGKERRVELADKMVAKVMRGCEEIEGQYLFQYLDDSGQSHSLTSSDVNRYLRDCSGEDFTAKDFRT
jgi:DNA topoisomerase-1